jgi:amino acid transporter
MMPEDRKERVDRELIELLNEIRIVLPGAQVLFAFLLSLPFLTRFDFLDRVDRAAYYAAFLCTAVGAIMLMAPSANHRLRFRDDDKEPMLLWFNRLVLIGSACLAAAIALAVFLVTDMLYDQRWAAGMAALIAAWLVTIWYVAPLWQRHRQSAE